MSKRGIGTKPGLGVNGVRSDAICFFAIVAGSPIRLRRTLALPRYSFGTRPDDEFLDKLSVGIAIYQLFKQIDIVLLPLLSQLLPYLISGRIVNNGRRG